MEWKKIDANNLPDFEVMAANFEPGTYGYKEKIIGYLGVSGGVIQCEREGEILSNCTHFIDINQYDIA